MQPEVQSVTGTQQILDFLICFRAPEIFVQVDKNKLRNFKSEHACNFATQEFGDQCLYTMARTSEFQYILEIIVRIY
ncbi:hypothetical protein D3C86_1639990 [compost metagenome]